MLGGFRNLGVSFYPHCSADAGQQHMAHMQWVNIQIRIRGWDNQMQPGRQNWICHERCRAMDISKPHTLPINIANTTSLRLRVANGPRYANTNQAQAAIPAKP